MISNNKTLLSNANVLLFHFRETKFKELPVYHSDDQIWIFYLTESPIHTCSNIWEYSCPLDKYDYLFNWTATYLPQSDILIQDSSFHRIKSKYFQNITSSYSLMNTMPPINSYQKEYSKGKKGLAVTVMSNCFTNNLRIKYISDIRNHVSSIQHNIKYANSRSLDIHGACSLFFSARPRLCLTPEDVGNSTHQQPDCLIRFISRYKFYLAFENSNCAHYVTEKMYRALLAGVVPVVFGARYSDYARVAPPFSFIYVASPLGKKWDRIMATSAPMT
ncbi:alpha-(1,3)-fucosyltransferase 7-like isoform X2 [Gordionus sp. m RMFG-2023]|uniref:alpha-(1,3)-fucosyltransferase 7-like isoform X2 n=1 Tax=Gordionus sp. m RMFG-2023 TaxID=3053472 RepID=UPI0031FD17EC